jgi:AcrR family transcriptional regulator
MPKKPQKKAAPRVYGGVSAIERQRDRRERLLRAGFELFGGAGYSAATIPAICATAGVIPRYFYESFGSREELLTEVFSRVVEQTHARVVNAIAGAPEDPLERTGAALSAFLHAYLDDPRAGRIACLEVGGVSPALERLRWTEMRRFAAIVEANCNELARRGLLPKRDFRMSSIALAGATNQLVIDFLSLDDPPSISALEREVLLLYLSLFEGVSAAMKTLSSRAPRVRRSASKA